MKVQSINNQNFGMAVKYNPSRSEVAQYLKQSLSPKKMSKSDEIIFQLERNKALTELALESKGKRVKLKATVGDGEYKENFFCSAYRVLKKSLKKSKEETHIELIADVLKILSKAE